MYIIHWKVSIYPSIFLMGIGEQTVDDPSGFNWTKIVSCFVSAKILTPNISKITFDLKIIALLCFRTRGTAPRGRNLLWILCQDNPVTTTITNRWYCDNYQDYHVITTITNRWYCDSCQDYYVTSQNANATDITESKPVFPVTSSTFGIWYLAHLA